MFEVKGDLLLKIKTQINFKDISCIMHIQNNNI